MVAPLSTRVPSQSKTASLFIAPQFMDGRHDVIPPGARLPSNGRGEVRAFLVLVELARAADRRRFNFEADDRLGQRVELRRVHFCARPWILRLDAPFVNVAEPVEEADQLFG